MMFGQVVPAVRHTPFLEHCFGKVCHEAGISCTMGTAVDEKDIEWFPVIDQLLPFLFRNKLICMAVADRAAFGRMLSRKFKSADGASPRYPLFQLPPRDFRILVRWHKIILRIPVLIMILLAVQKKKSFLSPAKRRMGALARIAH